MESFEIYSEYFSKIDNIYYWTAIIMAFIFLSKFEISHDKIKEKILFSYILLISFRFFNLIPIKFILLFTIIFYFIFIELVFMSEEEKKFINNGAYNILDYLYKIIFRYNYWLFVISLIVISNRFISIIKPFYFLPIDLYYFLGFISLIIYIITFSKTNTNRFSTFPLNEIEEKMENLLSFKGYYHDRRLESFSDILTNYEDRSYFSRPNSFNLFTFSFLIYRYNRVKSHRTGRIYKIKFLGVFLLHFNTCIIILFKLIKVILNKIIYLIKLFIRIIRKKKKIKTIRTIFRGYSTLEMQLIRTIALKSGYECTIQRKVYEFIYSNVFFKSLKKKYILNAYYNIFEFKYYLLHLYILTAPTFINGRRYDNIKELFIGRDNILELTNEEFFIFCLGLSGRWVSFKNIDYYYRLFNFDRMLLVKAIEETLGIVHYRVPDYNGYPITISLYNAFTNKKFPIIVYFDGNKTLGDIIKYINNYYCERKMTSIFLNLSEMLYGEHITKEALDLIDLTIHRQYKEYKDFLNLKVKDLYLNTNLRCTIVHMRYNCQEHKIHLVDNKIYYSITNENNGNIPYIICSYKGETMRVNIMNCDIIDGVSFTSPIKTNKALKYVKDNTDKLINIWDNIIDRNSDFYNEIGKIIYLKS